MTGDPGVPCGKHPSATKTIGRDRHQQQKIYGKTGNSSKRYMEKQISKVKAIRRQMTATNDKRRQVSATKEIK